MAFRQIGRVRGHWNAMPDPTLSEQRLLILTALERGDVRRAQLKPLTIGTAVGKPPMPVRFDARWVVRSDGVNQDCLLRQGNCNLLYTSLKFVAATDLVVSA